MTRKLALCAGLSAVVACGGNQQLALTLLTPEAWSDGGALDARSTFSMSVAWDGGDAGAEALGVDMGFSISVPINVPLDVLVFGAPLSGGSWRGELHGLTVSNAGGLADAGILMLPVGQVGSFLSAESSGLPLMSGAAVAPLGMGEVLITGVSDAGSAFIWDQAGVTFREAPATQLAWAHHGMSTTATGLFLLAGGDFAGTSIEYYSPEGSSGSVSADVLSVPQLFPSIASQGSSSFVGCGLDPQGNLTILDAGVSQLGGLGAAVGCSGGTLVTLSGGILAIGPDAASPVLGSLPIFNGPPMSRIGFGSLPDGTGGALVLGGFFDAGTSLLASAEIDDLLPGGSVVPLGNMSEARADYALVDAGGSVLAVGGIGPQTGPLSDLEVLPSPPSGPGVLVPLGQARTRPAALLVPGYRIVLILSGEKSVAGEPAPGIDLYAVP